MQTFVILIELLVRPAHNVGRDRREIYQAPACIYNMGERSINRRHVYMYVHHRMSLTSAQCWPFYSAGSWHPPQSQLPPSLTPQWQCSAISLGFSGKSNENPMKINGEMGKWRNNNGEMEKSVGKTNRTSNASSSRKTIDSPNFANLTVAQPPGNLASNETNASAAAEEPFLNAEFIICHTKFHHFPHLQTRNRSVSWQTIIIWIQNSSFWYERTFIFNRKNRHFISSESSFYIKKSSFCIIRIFIL